MIKPYIKNAKKHSGKQLKLIAKSLSQFGWQQPIKVGKDSHIIVGHGRWESYTLYKEKYNIKEAWIIDETGKTISGEPESKKLTEIEEKAYRLADNKISEGDWDMDLVVDELKEINDNGFEIESTGFDRELAFTDDDFDESFNLNSGDKNPFQTLSFTLSDDQAEIVKAKLKDVKGSDSYKEAKDGFVNKNSNGNALFYIIDNY